VGDSVPRLSSPRTSSRWLGAVLMATVLVAAAPWSCGGTADVAIGDDGGIDGGSDATGSCPAGQTSCNGMCADLSSNSDNCGSCGYTCDPNLVCVGGKCADHCPSPKNKCPSSNGNVCVELDNDPSNCGACSMVCPPEPHASPACAHSMCAVKCTAGYFDCNGNVTDGCEVDGLTDVNNCGGCGNACPDPPHAAATCSGGKCAMGACDQAYADCNHDPSDGCEVDLQMDLGNCGSCGHACTASGESCLNGSCACPNGQQVCGGACIDTQSDANDCGKCGQVCTAQGSTCINGSCSCPNAGMVCSGVCTNTQDDPNNCGKCANVCAAQGETCNSGTCGCPNGGQVCSGTCTDTQTDKGNCGSCGHACTATGQTCAAGSCACPNNGQVCSGACTNTQTDKNNCGNCGNVCQSDAGADGGTVSCSGGTCISGGCTQTALVLGDGVVASEQAYQNMLQAVGFNVTLISNGTTSYTGSPAASGFGVVIVTPGSTYTIDMPVAGQQSILSAVNTGSTGLVETEWVAYEVAFSRYQTYAPLVLVSRSSGTTSTLSFALTQNGHPIWNGVASTFTTNVALGANVSGSLQNGGTQIASCTECGGIGVAVRDNGNGRVVQIAHAAGYNMAAWYNDANLKTMMTNSAQWAARCL
jgi:hypothetical protein